MKKIYQRLKKHFTSLPHVLLVLGFIAIAAALGTVIPQGQPATYYQGRYGEFLSQLLLQLHLDNLFRSWWYLLAELWLLVSLAFCTLERARLAWKHPRWWGLVLAHTGLILILASLLVTPYVTQHLDVDAVPGQTVNLNEQHFPFDLRVDRFHVEYYPDGLPKQYLTQVILLQQGQQVCQGTIAVNHPLSYRGVKIYQMSYGWMLKGRLLMGNQTIPFSILSGPDHPLALGPFHQLIAEYYPNAQGQPQVFYALYFQGKPVTMGLLPLGKEGDLTGAKIVFDQAEQYTGLEVKKNPALPLTFAGFILASLGVLLHLIWHPRRAQLDIDREGGK
ncbi:cytochrome c biogenesis protein ResB [Desulfothermobacter acidiphilus]|uniref:cytochrome c biogenesis protein ResB n=1 Tax=Desulfothermobacter acidiphilus TaxID=1938353 RepID=UPI003F8C1590